MPQDTISIVSREVPELLQPVPRNKRPGPLPINADEKIKIATSRLEENKGNAVINNIKAIQLAPKLKGYNIDNFA